MWRQSGVIPVVTTPIVSVILYKFVTEHVSINLSNPGYFYVITTTESFPLTPIDVIPDVLTALNEFSTYFNLPSGLNTVIYNSC